MYEVYVLTKELFTLVASDENGPIIFETDTDAWDFIESIMQLPDHPRFAWVNKMTVKENITN